MFLVLTRIYFFSTLQHLDTIVWCIWEIRRRLPFMWLHMAIVQALSKILADPLVFLTLNQVDQKSSWKFLSKCISYQTITKFKNYKIIVPQLMFTNWSICSHFFSNIVFFWQKRLVNRKNNRVRKQFISQRLQNCNLRKIKFSTDMCAASGIFSSCIHLSNRTKRIIKKEYLVHPWNY